MMQTDGFSFWQQFIVIIKELTVGFAQTVSTNMATTITPIVGAALVIWMAIYLFLIGIGQIQMPFLDALKRFVIINFVVGFALTSGIYQSTWAGLISSAQDSFAQQVSGNPSATAASVVDMVAGAGFDRAGQAWAMAGALSASGWGMAGLAVIIFVVTLFVAGMTMIMTLVASVGLSILGGIGPLFIIACLFQWSRGMFSQWLAQVLNYWMVILLVSLVATFFMSLFDRMFRVLQFDGSMNIVYVGAAVGFLGMVAAAFLRQVYRLASITGGIALSMDRVMPNLPRPNRRPPPAPSA